VDSVARRWRNIILNKILYHRTRCLGVKIIQTFNLIMKQYLREDNFITSSNVKVKQSIQFIERHAVCILGLNYR